MKWVTYSHLHLDRVATPWLILRFVDHEAEFAFIERGNERDIPNDAVAFGIPGTTFGPHDGDGTAFRKVMRAYEIGDPAVDLVERIVAAGVRHALDIAPPATQTEEEALLGAALDRLGQGLAIAFDDDAHLAAALPLYDALYANCRVRVLPSDVASMLPTQPVERIDYLRRALRPSLR
jgi:hypothetical protein